MNQKLLNEHIAATTQIMYEPLKKDGSNVQDFFCPDVVTTKKFAKNHGGYPRSDIAEINAQTNLQTQLALLQNLQDFSPKTNPNSGLTDAQISLSHRSKYQQAPSEMQDWLGEQIKLRDAVRYQAAQKAKKAAATKKGSLDEKPDTSIVADPE